MTLKTGFLSLEMGNVLNNMTMERKIGKWSLGRYFPEIFPNGYGHKPSVHIKIAGYSPCITV